MWGSALGPTLGQIFQRLAGPNDAQHPAEEQEAVRLRWEAISQREEAQKRKAAEESGEQEAAARCLLIVF